MIFLLYVWPYGSATSVKYTCEIISMTLNKVRRNVSYLQYFRKSYQENIIFSFLSFSLFSFLLLSLLPLFLPSFFLLQIISRINYILRMKCVHVRAQPLQSCLTLCDLVDCSPPGSSMGFSRQEDWLPCPPPGGLPDSGIEPVTLASSALTGVFFMTSANWEALEWSMLLLLLSRFSCVRLCNPMDGSPPGSPIPGILQARTLEWVATSLSNAWKWKMKVKLLSRVQLPATPWTAAYKAPPSMGFSRQEHWSGLPLPSPRMNYA